MIFFKFIFIVSLVLISFMATGSLWILVLGLFTDRLPTDWIVLLPPMALTVGLWCLFVVKANKEKVDEI
jgi:hypothetical protein